MSIIWEVNKSKGVKVTSESYRNLYVDETNQVYFIHPYQGKVIIGSKDSEGDVYFYSNAELVN